jgi:hypothetical protein
MRLDRPAATRRALRSRGASSRGDALGSKAHIILLEDGVATAEHLEHVSVVIDDEKRSCFPTEAR